MGTLLDNQWFEAIKNNNTSQHGEDGIISEIFSQIKIKHRYVVECGAADGMKNSNAYSLITNHDWVAFLIEGDITAYEALKSNYLKYPKVLTLNNFISFEGKNSFDSLFVAHAVPQDFDLLILDIDGNEYHVWESMKKYRPRVVMVEFNQTIPNGVDFVQPKDMAVQQGSSLDALNRLALTLRYRLVAITDINAFFVAEECASPFTHLDNSINSIRPYNPYETKIFQLYDGTLKLAGNKTLLWHKYPISEEKIQVLPKNRRIYLNGINSNETVRKIKYLARKSFIYPLILKVRKVPFFRNIMR